CVGSSSVSSRRRRDDGASRHARIVDRPRRRTHLPERFANARFERGCAAAARDDFVATHEDDRVLVADAAEDARQLGRRDLPSARKLVAMKLTHVESEARLALLPRAALSERAVRDLAERAIFTTGGLLEDVEEHRAKPGVAAIDQDQRLDVPF